MEIFLFHGQLNNAGIDKKREVSIMPRHSGHKAVFVTWAIWQGHPKSKDNFGMKAFPPHGYFTSTPCFWCQNVDVSFLYCCMRFQRPLNSFIFNATLLTRRVSMNL